MSWTKWQSLKIPSGHSAPAVYELRMTNDHGEPVTIPRYLASDDRGVLTIGQSSSMERRRGDFIYAVKHGSRHSAANLLYLLLRYTPLNNQFPEHQLEFRFHPESDKAAAKAAESRLIKQYIREFGEPPPLNCAIPNRWRDWETEEDG